MDPNLFFLDYERILQVVAGIAFLSVLVERALAVFLESTWFLKLTGELSAEKEGKKVAHPKEVIALVVSILVCWIWDFDAFSIIFLKETTTALGFILTGAVVAGGSKGSVKLFHDVFNIMSSAKRKAKDLQK
jgi:hypothetical protein